MIIDSLSRRPAGGRVRLSARVRHENSDRSEHVVFFEVDAAHEAALAAGYEAFALSMTPVAHVHGEARVHVEGGLCPLLTEQLRSATMLLRRWDPADRPAVAVSATEARVLPVPSPRVATFTSGGLDSTYNLVTNAHAFPRGDPRRIDTAVLVDGLDINDPNLPIRDDVFAEAKRTVGEFVGRYGCELLTVRTNLRSIEPSEAFYGPRQIGCALAGIAHALGGRIGTCHLGLETYLARWNR